MIIHDEPENRFLKIQYYSQWEEAYQKGSIYRFAEGAENRIQSKIPELNAQQAQLVINLCMRWALDQKEHKLAFYASDDLVLQQLEEALRDDPSDIEAVLQNHMDESSAQELNVLRETLFEGNNEIFVNVVHWLLTDWGMEPVVREHCPDVSVKVLAKFEKERVKNEVIRWMENSDGMHLPSLLLDFGDQVVLGASIYWDTYVDTIKEKIETYLRPMSEDVLILLCCEGDTEDCYLGTEGIDESYFSTDTPDMISQISEEIFQNICHDAEVAYDEYIASEEEKQEMEREDEEDEEELDDERDPALDLYTK